MLAARLLLEASGCRKLAAGTPWLCGAAPDARHLGHPRAGEAGTRALSAAVEVTVPMTAGDRMNGRMRTCAGACSAPQGGTPGKWD